VSWRRAGASLLAWCLALGGATAQSVSHPDSPSNLLDRLEAAWKARDLDAYIALWAFENDQAKDDEREFAQARFASDRAQIEVQRPASIPEGHERLGFGVQTFSSTEPRARLEQWAYVMERRGKSWAFVKRESRGGIEGLVHLSLDPVGYRADGLTFRFEDFELEMHRGTLFGSPALVGPTLFVFVGEGSVRFHPTPVTEQAQLRLFAGRPDLDERVQSAFLRIHPADLHRFLSPVRLEADPQASKRRGAAEEMFREQVGRALVLDALLPGSPWWILPSLGDSLVTFKTARRGTLTYAMNADDPEGISLFDRSRRRQICLYPPSGGGVEYDEDDGRAVDVLHHDLRLRIGPEHSRIEGRDTIRMRLLSPAPWVRLRLDDALRIESVTSPEAGRHLFLRVRDQDSVMVSLGPWSSALAELSLEVRYSGVLHAGPVEREALQTAPGEAPGTFGANLGTGLSGEELNLERVLVYTNRSAWYPQGAADDHATADLAVDVPAGYTAVTGGERVSARIEDQRALIRYSQKLPGRYISMAVGRLAQVEERTDAEPALRGFSVSRTRSDVHETLDRASAILSFYTGEFGPCPYPSLSLVLMEGLTPGGHSPPGMVVVARRPPLLRAPLAQDPGDFSDVPDFFLAHELAHQWWGHGVAGKNYHDRWISEAFAQYAAALWVRQSRGEKPFRELLDRFGDWAFRGNDAGPISLGNRLGRVSEDPRAFRAVVYDKGAYVLHMLRGLVGDDAFRNGLRSLQQTYRFRKAGTADLRAALEAASGRDLRAYFQEWVFGTTLPRLQILHRTERENAGSTHVEVRAEGLPGAVPLQICVRHQGGTVRTRVELPPEGGRFTIQTPGRARDISINDDAGLLARIGG
jgi:hypothetical protein